MRHAVKYPGTTLAALLLSLLSTTSTVALGEVFRVELPQLNGSYSSLYSSATAPVDLGTRLASLAGIQLELSGIHTMGWWVGDMVEDFYMGPMAGDMLASMDSASPLFSRWMASYSAEESGPFTAVLSLQDVGGGANWSFLRDGVTDLTLTNAPVFGWGHFTTPPSFRLDHVALVIDATPVIFEPGDVDKNGKVDIFDVAVLQTKYGMTSGATWADGDFDGNGTVDILDVALMQVNYGHGVGNAPAPVPEPSALALAAIALAAVIAIRPSIGWPRRPHGRRR